jgi:hypothetical protein
MPDVADCIRTVQNQGRAAQEAAVQNFLFVGTLSLITLSRIALMRAKNPISAGARGGAGGIRLPAAIGP